MISEENISQIQFRSVKPSDMRTPKHLATGKLPSDTVNDWELDKAKAKKNGKQKQTNKEKETDNEDEEE